MPDIAYVNGTDRSNAGNNDGAFKVTTSWNVNLIAGNSAIVCVFWKSLSNIASILDSAGNSYIDCGAGEQSRAGDGQLQVFGCKSLLAGTTPSIVFTWTGNASAVDIFLHQYANGDPTTQFDVTATAQATSGTTLVTPTFTPTVSGGMVFSFAVTNDTNGLVGLIGGTNGTSRFAPAGWGEITQDRIYSGAMGSNITAAANFSTSFTLGRIIAAVVRPGSSLTKKVRIPTALADGTQRVLVAFTDTGLGTKLATPQLVTASGGFFKLAAAAAVVGTKYPAVLWSFGADQTVDARGGPCWATGIEE